GNGNGQHIVLGIQKGPVVAHREVHVARGDKGRLRGKVEQREPVVVGIAGDHLARRERQRVGLHYDEERVGGPAAVTAVGGHEDLLLGTGGVLVGRGIGYGVVVLLVDGGGIIEDLQVRVAKGDQGGVHRQVEGGDPVVGGTAVHKVVAGGQVVPYTDGREQLYLQLEGGHPGAAGDQALQAHPDGLCATTYICGGIWDFRSRDTGLGIGLQFIIGDRQKVRRVLHPEHAFVLKGQVKDGRAAAALVAPDEWVRERWHKRHIGKVDHVQLQLHDGETANARRRNIFYHTRIYGLYKGHDIDVGHQDLRPGDTGNGIGEILIIEYGNVRLAGNDIEVRQVKVPAANDPVVVVVAELQGVRRGIGVRVRQHGKGKGN